MSIFVNENQGAYGLTSAGYAACIVILAAVLLLASVAAKRSKAKRMGTKQLVFCAVAIALAMVASMLKI